MYSLRVMAWHVMASNVEDSLQMPLSSKYGGTVWLYESQDYIVVSYNLFVENTFKLVNLAVCR